jgi:hypothetical protein
MRAVTTKFAAYYLLGHDITNRKMALGKEAVQYPHRAPLLHSPSTLWKYLLRPPGALYAAAAELRSDWSTQKLPPGMKEPVCFQSIQK